MAPKGGANRKDTRNRAIFAAFLEGQRTKEIARQFGITENRVRKIVTYEHQREIDARDADRQF